jgi:hypothetical protein
MRVAVSDVNFIQRGIAASIAISAASPILLNSEHGTLSVDDFSSVVSVCSVIETNCGDSSTSLGMTIS